MKYQPERDLELATQELKTCRPSALSNWVLNKRNKKVTPESVTMFFKRHPDIKQRIDEYLKGIAPTVADPVSQAMFENGNFQQIESVKEWILCMRMRRRKNKPLKHEYIVKQLRELKYICFKYNKHPDRLTVRDAQEIFIAEEDQGKDTYSRRRTLKDFLKSKRAEGWEQIGVGKPRGFGQYKDMKIPLETAERMIAWVKERNFEAGVADDLMFHICVRINAVATATIENYFKEDPWQKLKVLEKFREWKTFKIVPEVAAQVDMLIGDRKSGRIFFPNIALEMGKKNVATLNNRAIDLFCPELRLKYKHIHPNHVWRHFGIQILLDLTNKNTKAVAAIVQCTEQSLNESYGAATTQDVERWENKYLPMLTQKVAYEKKLNR